MASDKPKRKKKKKDGRPFLESGRLILYTLVATFVFSLIALLGLHWTPVQAMLIHLGFVSLVTFSVFAIDKLRAKHSARRVSEFNLMALGALGGAAGGLLAMAVLRHKTQRTVFTIGLPILMFIHGVGVAVVLLR